MLAVIPSIDPAVTALAPGFRALSITVEAAPILNPEVAAQALARACRAVASDEAPWAEAHLAAWSETFKQFGAKPKRTPCSAEALRKRVLRDGAMPSIDPVVDLYNAVSIQYAVPVGGENISAYVGEPKLTVASGDELFDTVKEGALAHESPEPGEVVWRDEQGVTCRRWNWRQGVRTRLSSDASRMWFILEGLPAMPLEALHAAGDELIAGLRLMMPGMAFDTRLIGFDGR
ncbi:B3/4 domain-containing protein [Serratia ficaria]|uniref:B3/B4 domain-containing protein n=1 Tax=Serratia ficaria TaxID=61651 RepID=UPI00077C7196|nr:B3/4 domain-containing protein [Serratia ficaria]MEE4484570.1 B3/4 domain-containing protein [Serratia ficaria]CAI0877103.1 B3/4 domain [Serratia ficaria]CAI1131805.1 B3/4 domain [Serratia ficaria]CAI1932718.1 B3/4 domain [Serratia ficaria]CAI2429722.1 B3/4 domain [Serratia ficaria]